MGAIDQITLGIPLGLYHLVTGTAHGLKELATGDAEQGLKELVPALLLIVSSLGVKTYRSIKKKSGWTKTASGAGAQEARQFIIKGYSGPLSREAARLGAMLELNGEAQGAAGLLLERYGQQGLLALVEHIRANSGTIRFIHRHGIRALDALLEAKGNLKKAQETIQFQPAAQLPPGVRTKPSIIQPNKPPANTNKKSPSKPSVPSTKPVGELSAVKGWERFDPALNEKFQVQLQRFRGNTDLKVPPKGGLRGGEGQLFLSDQAPGKAIKRWFTARRKDMAQSVKLLQDAEAAVQANHKLHADIKVVRIHEQGPDWIIRDFEPKSMPLSEALGSAEPAAAFNRVVVELQRMKAAGPLPDALENILKKLTRPGKPSENIHWSPEQGKLLIIDLQ